MIYKIIIAIAGIVGSVWIFKIKNDKFSIGLTAILALSILFIFIPIPIIRQIGGICLLLGVSLAIFYGIFVKRLNYQQRILTLTISMSILVSQLGMLLQWTNYQLTGPLMLIPIFGYIYILVKGVKHFINQFGFLTILISYAIARLALVIQQWT